MNRAGSTETSAVEAAVHERYTEGARRREAALCCPVDYDPRYLEAIPSEVIERDYGCGDPSRFAREGDTVLDLGSGSGKICFIASQVVGPAGRVIGLDMNDEMLRLARGAAPEVARRVGHANVEFRRGLIQDLRLDVDRLDAWLADHPVRSALDLAAMEEAAARIRREHPLVGDDSVDLIVTNCVLNLVREGAKRDVIRECFRVLRRGGRLAISDIVSDEPVPDDLKADPALWSGCVSGAMQESELLTAIEEAGFHGVAIDTWVAEPFRVVNGIEFRSVTVTARKGKQGPCFEENQAVIYKGPFRQVEDDDHHVMRRGERTAVCAKTYGILNSEPYAEHFVPVPPREETPQTGRRPFDCSRTAPRHPRETKGMDYAATTGPGECCPPGECC
ncbi:MAG TPA: methyltransferase domain-containing protein [Candidatus Polarisedimenticolia bacterium]|nr:methyltransferase domain-containing protein [Candidatus Polarisedimenticolia bacterium]